MNKIKKKKGKQNVQSQRAKKKRLTNVTLSKKIKFSSKGADNRVMVLLSFWFYLCKCKFINPHLL